MTDRKTLRIERTFRAPAERVFDAFTSEEVMRRWFHPGIDWSTPEASVDLRIGGEIRIVIRDPADGSDHGARGRYTVIEPPERLAFTWLWDDNPEQQVEQLIEIDFSERGGVTRVRFTHHELWDAKTAAEHEDGWTKVLDNLETELASPE